MFQHFDDEDENNDDNDTNADDGFQLHKISESSISVSLVNSLQYWNNLIIVKIPYECPQQLSLCFPYCLKGSEIGSSSHMTRYDGIKCICFFLFEIVENMPTMVKQKPNPT